MVTICPTISTVRYIPKRIKNTCPHKSLDMNFHRTIFMIVKKWGQPKCPSTDKIWYVHAMEYYLARKEQNIDACYSKDEF
jgi:hypothetical protein